jgi:hypothetical protein
MGALLAVLIIRDLGVNILSEKNKIEPEGMMLTSDGPSCQDKQIPEIITDSEGNPPNETGSLERDAQYADSLLKRSLMRDNLYEGISLDHSGSMHSSDSATWIDSDKGNKSFSEMSHE